MIWIVTLTALATFLLVMVGLNLARPEKKLSWKIEHRYALSDPQFRREMSVMLGPSITAGNSVVALQNGAEIFPAMLAAIRAAQTSITFETYIYWSGDIGEKFTAALIERAQAGVPVCWRGGKYVDAFSSSPVVLIQLSLNAAWNCATTGPSILKCVSRQWSGFSAVPSHWSAIPTPPVNPMRPSTMRSLRCVRWLSRRRLYQRSGR